MYRLLTHVLASAVTLLDEDSPALPQTVELVLNFDVVLALVGKTGGGMYLSMGLAC